MRKLITSIFILVMILGVSGCNLSPKNLNPTPFFPTPNYTMTALFTVDENKPTNPPPDFSLNTTEPELPTLNPIVPATEVPTQVVPTNTPTPTAIPPTNTPLPPTMTSTEAPIRPGTWVTGKYMPTPPVFDSVWDEWEAIKYPAKNIVYGKDNWKNSEDLEGSFRVGWNDTYLYIAVKVLDDKYVQNSTGKDLYKGDSIEILLDTNLYGDLNEKSLSSDDYQIGISPGKGGTDGPKEAYLWYPSGKAGNLSDVLIASSGGDGVYRVEIGIPWSVFGVTPTKGQQFGFGLSISDNDDPSQNVQQSMVSNLTNRTLTDPTTWTVLTLAK